MTAFSPPNRIKSFILLAISGVLALVAAVTGIDDNPPAILMAYLAALAFVLAFVHPWRTAKPFAILLGASVLGLVLFVILNNAFAFVAHDPSTVGAFQKWMQGLAVTAFFLATLIFPAGFLIGAIGAIVMLIHNRHRSA